MVAVDMTHMSDDYLLILPATPEHVPEPGQQALAMAVAIGLTATRDGVEMQERETATFLDCGANFDAVRCPACEIDLHVDGWWGDRMAEAHAEDFADLRLTTPCCHIRTSLNDLTYVQTQGFARWWLELFNRSKPLNPSELRKMEKAVGHPIRVISVHL